MSWWGGGGGGFSGTKLEPPPVREEDGGGRPATADVLLYPTVMKRIAVGSSQGQIDFLD